MSICRYINFNKSIAVVQDVNSARGYMCLRVRVIGEFSVLDAEFCCEPETTLESSIY